MSIVTLDEVRDYLNISSTNTSVNQELQRFIDAADPVVENIVGPVNQADFDEFYDGGWPSIVLRHAPVLTVDTVTEYAGQVPTTLTAAATPDVAVSTSYMLDPDGIIYRAWPGASRLFAVGSRNIRVQYTAGREAVPPNVKLATLELIRHLYQSTQQSGRPAFGGAAEDQPWAPASFAIPTRVIELLEPYRREPRSA
jgi:hypothetical protein